MRVSSVGEVMRVRTLTFVAPLALFARLGIAGKVGDRLHAVLRRQTLAVRQLLLALLALLDLDDGFLRASVRARGHQLRSESALG